MRRIEGAPRFLQAASKLGAVDVRRGGSSASLYVFVHADTDEPSRDAVRALAQAEWPRYQIVLAVKSPMRESGVKRVSELRRAVMDADVVELEGASDDASDPRSSRIG